MRLPLPLIFLMGLLLSPQTVLGKSAEKTIDCSLPPEDAKVEFIVQGYFKNSLYAFSRNRSIEITDWIARHYNSSRFQSGRVTFHLDKALPKFMTNTDYIVFLDQNMKFLGCEKTENISDLSVVKEKWVITYKMVPPGVLECNEPKDDAKVNRVFIGTFDDNNLDRYRRVVLIERWIAFGNDPSMPKWKKLILNMPKETHSFKSDIRYVIFQNGSSFVGCVEVDHVKDLESKENEWRSRYNMSLWGQSLYHLRRPKLGLGYHELLGPSASLGFMIDGYCWSGDYCLSYFPEVEFGKDGMRYGIGATYHYWILARTGVSFAWYQPKNDDRIYLGYEAHLVFGFFKIGILHLPAAPAKFNRFFGVAGTKYF